MKDIPPPGAARQEASDDDVDVQELEQGLSSILPFYTPLVAKDVSGGKKDSTSRSDMQFELSYHVVSIDKGATITKTSAAIEQLQRAFQNEYRNLISRSTERDALGRRAISAKDVSNLLSKLSNADLPNAPSDATDVPIELIRPSLFHLPVIVLPQEAAEPGAGSLRH